MKSLEKEKICISCEGRIPIHIQICPFCASDQSGPRIQNSFQTPIFQNQSLEDSLTSLYTPPYQGKRPQFGQIQDTPYEMPYETPHMDDEERPHYKEVTKTEQVDPLFGATVDEEPTEKSSLLPTLLLIGGVNIFILGLMQLFFSKNGVLRLEWNATYWFFYCLLASPLLYFGYKKFKEL